MSNAFLELRHAIGGKLGAILVADGFRTDVGAAVYYEAVQTEADDPPRTAILTRRWSRREMTLGAHERLIEVMVLVTVGANYSNAQQIAEDAVEDVLQALPNPVDAQLNPRTRAEYQVTDGEILRRPDGMACIAAAISINAKLIERTL